MHLHHWWSKCIKFPLTTVLSFFNHRNNTTVSLDLDRLQEIIYKELLLLRWSPHFSTFEPFKNNPLKK